jgi:hypothetical protein
MTRSPCLARASAAPSVVPSLLARRRRLVVLALLALGLAVQPAASARAQGLRGGGGFFSVGVSTLDLGGVNDRLAAAGYPSLVPRAVSIGGGGYARLGRVLVGGEGHGLVGPAETGRGRDVQAAGGYGLLTVGYLLRPSSRARVYPFAGVGLGGLSLNLGPAGDAPAFDDVLDNPGRSADLTQGAFLVALGAGGAYTVAGGAYGGLRVGLRGGYRFAPAASAWQLGDVDTTGDPAGAALSGFFLHLTLGGGGGR